MFKNVIFEPKLKTFGSYVNAHKNGTGKCLQYSPQYACKKGWMKLALKIGPLIAQGTCFNFEELESRSL